MLKNNIDNILKELSFGNNYNEKVTLVAATKTISAETVNEAISFGITDIGENKVNEFKEKYDSIIGANRHFIGHLQTNKVKYLIGKTFLIHSVDRFELAEEISKRSKSAEITTDILLQINIGKEQSKGGFYIQDAISAYEKIKNLGNIRIKGFMAMLPLSDDIKYLENLCLQMRKLYDTIKSVDNNIEYLSMGMSGDYKTAINCGSNMVRLGSSIFGTRNYNI